MHHVRVFFKKKAYKKTRILGLLFTLKEKRKVTGGARRGFKVNFGTTLVGYGHQSPQSLFTYLTYLRDTKLSHI